VVEGAVGVHITKTEVALILEEWRHIGAWVEGVYICLRGSSEDRHSCKGDTNDSYDVARVLCETRRS